jgi:membrane-bound ClpP family serine protease
MGANHSQQGWALLIFVVGFTFFVGGLFALGPISTLVGLVCLIASGIWCYRIKPLEQNVPEPVGVPSKERRAV